MECAVVRRNGDSLNVTIRDLSPVAAENLSELAVVVAMTPGCELSTVYQNRTTRQAYVNRDDLRELARKQAQYDERCGWIS